MQHSCKKYLCYFLGNIGKIEQLFIPSSGHTAPCPEKCVYGGSIFLIAIIPLSHSLKIISFSGLGTERCVRMGAFSVLDWLLWAVALQWRNLLPNQLMFILEEWKVIERINELEAKLNDKVQCCMIMTWLWNKNCFTTWTLLNFDVELFGTTASAQTFMLLCYIDYSLPHGPIRAFIFSY